MENSEYKRVSILADEPVQNSVKNRSNNRLKNKIEKFKKPMVFTLMGVVFLGCLYLVFKPSSAKNKIKGQIGLNEVVPGATGLTMQSDKQKAYEQALFEQKKQKEKNTLTSLSDYWNSEGEGNVFKPELSEARKKNQPYVFEKSNHQALAAYQNVQNTLSSFYKDDRNYETERLKKEIILLKDELTKKDTKPSNTMQDQLMLMEKSYEMASRYFPAVKSSTVKDGQKKRTEDTLLKVFSNKKIKIQPLLTAQKSIISALSTDVSGDEFQTDQTRKRGQRFFTPGAEKKNMEIRSSISACIYKTQKVTAGDVVAVMLLEPVNIAGFMVPKGHLLSGIVKVQANRLQLLITSVAYQGNIIPTHVQLYDLDGQEGLLISNSPEKNALKEIISNMGTNTGTNISFNSSAGQQIASDLSRSFVQGFSGYFSKKVKIPKVKLKAGQKVLLISKK